MASDVGNNQDFCQDFAKCARSKRRNALVPELQKNLFDDDISANLPADIRKLSVKGYLYITCNFFSTGTVA
ncbi:unnamed protein product [Clavelina lepadiformis]|uniref:Uncharacterized protein n=1 Tax=Clavelina lepadiformis TaxID=159417 RepID=A0ABP0GX25_CLALP